MAEPDAVDEVRDAPAQDEAERDRKHGMPAAGAREEHEHRPDRDRGDRDHDRRPAREEPERDPGVLRRGGCENGPTMSTLSPSSSVRPTTCFVSWSATTAAPATSSRASHCARPAASERSADETGCSAFAVEPMRTSTCGVSMRAGSLRARAPAPACRRCRAWRRERPRAAPRRSGRHRPCRGRTCPSSIRPSAASISASRCSAFSSRPSSSSRRYVSVGAVGDVVARSRSRGRRSPRAATRRGARPGARAGAVRARPRGRRRKRVEVERSLMRSPRRPRAAVSAVARVIRRVRRPCRAKRGPATSSRSRARTSRHLASSCEDGVVRPAALGRRADPHLPGVAVAADDPRAPRARDDAQPQTSCAGRHGPKDIRGSSLRPCGSRSP